MEDDGDEEVLRASLFEDDSNAALEDRFFRPALLSKEGEAGDLSLLSLLLLFSSLLAVLDDCIATKRWDFRRVWVLDLGIVFL